MIRSLYRVEVDEKLHNSQLVYWAKDERRRRRVAGHPPYVSTTTRARQQQPGLVMTVK